MHSIGGVFSVALSSGFPKFALRTTMPFGVRTFLSGTWPERPGVHPIFQKKDCLPFVVYTLVGKLIGPFILLAWNMRYFPGIKLF